MSILRSVLLAIGIISCGTFVALFGQLPALRRTPVGWLHRLLCVRLPRGLSHVDDRLTGGRTVAGTQRTWHYLFYEQNPIVLIVFLTIVTGSAGLFLWNAWHKLPIGLKIPIPIILIQPYIWTYKCATYQEHYIRPTNHSRRMQDYPYDHVLFHPGRICSTCRDLKPPRSKHCSLCGVCVARSDHHCPWVNTCVGRGNYVYFLALLLGITVLEIYGSFCAWWILRHRLHLPFPGTPLFSRARLDGLLSILRVAVAAGGLSITGVGMLAVLTFPLPLTLLLYHLYLIWAGMTTNESSKWADWKDDTADGLAFRASLAAVREYEKSLEGSDDATEDYERRGGGAEAGGSSSSLYENMRARIRYTYGFEPAVSWPKRSDQILVTTEDGQPPAGRPEGLWTRVWDLKDVENVYDVGALANFKMLFTER